MAHVLGMNCKAYYGTAEAELSSMTELTNVKDVTLNFQTGEADITTRANDGWKATAATLRCNGIPRMLALRQFKPPGSILPRWSWRFLLVQAMQLVRKGQRGRSQ
jgi:hypothetical protein